jgi:hypothetical protein
MAFQQASAQYTGDSELPVMNKVLKQKDNSTYYYSNSKEIGLNFTSLISSLVPFNIGEKQTGLVGIKTKFYGRKEALRLSFGTSLNSNTNEFQFFHVGIGYEKRKILAKKISYTTGWEAIVETTTQIIVNGTNNFRNSSTFIAASKFYGLEYNINETFFIGTEAQLLIGIGRGAQLKFNAPIAIFLNVRLKK